MQANFYFVCADPAKLSRELALESIQATFDVAGVGNEGQELYDKYVAFVEDDGTPKDTGSQFGALSFALPGESFRFNTAAAEAVLQEKFAHESPAFRKAGNVSTKAPAFLTEKTLAIIIGSRRFLSTNAYLYFERYGLLRDQVIPLIIEIGALRERKTRQGETYVYCPVHEESFYPGNFDALLQQVRGTKRMSTQDLMAHLSGDDQAS